MWKVGYLGGRVWVATVPFGVDVQVDELKIKPEFEPLLVFEGVRLATS